MKRIIFFMAILFAMVGCEKSSLEKVPDGELIPITVKASMPSNADTRVSVSQGESEEDDWTLAWEEDDELLFQEATAGSNYFKLQIAEIDSKSGVATFTGAVQEGSYYVLVADKYYIEDGAVCIDLNEQEAGCNTPPMIHNDVITIDATTTSSDIDVAFTHMTQAMDIKVSLANANSGSTYTLTNVAISGAYDGNETYYKFDNINVSVDNVVLTNDVHNVYCCMPPFDVVADGTITLTATILVDGAQKVVSTTITNNSGETINFEAGKHNYLNATFDCEDLKSNNWINFAASSFADGVVYDEEIYSYIIETPEQLAYLAKLVDEDKKMENRLFTLANSISLEGREWFPIGGGYYFVQDQPWDDGVTYGEFKGIFDGGNFEVSGLRINERESDFSGLFGYIKNATIKNVSVSGAITSTTADILGVGGVVGYADYSDIINCHNSVAIDCKANFVGGIAGSTGYGHVSNCSNSASVKGLETVGGVVGQLTSTTINCSNSGEIEGATNVGGVAGISAARVVNSFNIGNVEGDEYVGGISGLSTTTTENCYNSGAITGDSNVGAIVGTSYGSSVKCYRLEGCVVENESNTDGIAMSKEQMQAASGFVEVLNNGAYEYNVNNQSPTALAVPGTVVSSTVACKWVAVKDAYPAFNYIEMPTYTLYDLKYNAIEDLYEINSDKGLKAFADLVNGNSNDGGAFVSLSSDNSFGSKNLSIDGKLTQNIDLTTICGEDIGDWTPIGKSRYIGEYNGTFNGDSFRVSGLYINNKLACQALFGCVGEEGVVENLIVDGSVTAGKFSFPGIYYIAGVAGVNSGKIERCYNLVDVDGNNTDRVGGITGYNCGTIIQCANSGDIVTEGASVGGIVGESGDKSSVSHCYNTGYIKSEGNGGIGGIVGDNDFNTSISIPVENCYNVGKISSGDSNSNLMTGGVIGDYGTSGCNNCYYLNVDGMFEFTSNSNHQLSDAGEAITSEAEMKNDEFLGKLNANDEFWTYIYGENNNYPVLKWQIIND